MKIFHSFILLVFLLVGSQNLFSQKTTNDVIKLINTFFESNKTLKGNFELYEKGKGVQRGYFMFKEPHFFKMVFAGRGRSEKYKKRIISDGKTLWVYLPRRKIVIDQDLKNLTPIGISTQMLGIRRLLQFYTPKFHNNNSKLVKSPDLPMETYILELNAKDKRNGFQKILFYVDKDGFIVKSKARTFGGKEFSIIRKNVKLKIKIDSKEFRREAPKDAVMIKNPFVSGRGY